MGILRDRSGNDGYFGHRYAQGFGAHQALGALLDDDGDDSYFNVTAAGQGAAWDESIGLLVDARGNDTYHADGLSQGAAAMQAIGMLIDLGGTDHYVAAGASQGQSGTNEYHFAESGCFSFSLQLDAGGGVDSYSAAARGNDRTLVTGARAATQPAQSDLHGLFIDNAMTFPPR
jgi:hypothetical protein